MNILFKSRKIYLLFFSFQENSGYLSQCNYYKGKNQKPVKKLNAAFEIFDDATQRRQKMKKYNKTFEFPSSLQKMKKKNYMI